MSDPAPQRPSRPAWCSSDSAVEASSDPRAVISDHVSNGWRRSPGSRRPRLAARAPPGACDRTAGRPRRALAWSPARSGTVRRQHRRGSHRRARAPARPAAATRGSPTQRARSRLAELTWEAPRSGGHLRSSTEGFARTRQHDRPARSHSTT